MSPLVFSQATGGGATSYTQSADHHRVVAGQSAELTESFHLQQQQQFIEMNSHMNGTRHVVPTKGNIKYKNEIPQPSFQ